jgi:cold shock CspA family protein
VWPQRRDIVSAPNTSRGAPLHSKVKRVGSSPDVSTKREQGRVLSIKDHFGFLECTSQAGLPDIFFHLREVQNSVKLKPSDRVDFVLRPDSKNSGRYDAVSVRLSGAGSWMDAGEDESSLAIQDDLSDLSLPPASSPRISAFAADAAPAAQANMFGNTKAMMTWLDGSSETIH